jgi:transcriptional regulator with XRE-family HTH domain
VPDVAKRFAENLAYYREQSGLSQEALASRAEIHRTQIGELLRGKQLPRLDTFVKLAGALDVPPTDLLEGISWEPAVQTGQFRLSAPSKRQE